LVQKVCPEVADPLTAARVSHEILKSVAVVLKEFSGLLCPGFDFIAEAEVAIAESYCISVVIEALESKGDLVLDCTAHSGDSSHDFLAPDLRDAHEDEGGHDQ